MTKRRNTDVHAFPAAPSPTNVDWARLIATAEFLRIPVSRVDDQGDIHIIRTTQQLRKEWA